MSVSRDNPLSIDVLEDYSGQPDIQGELKELVENIRSVDNANAGWARKQLRLIKERFGKRKKKRVPWVGASNVNIPLTDGVIRRWRPGIVSLVYDADPIAFFTARSNDDYEPARSAESFFTWLFTERMDTARDLARLADLIAARGHAYSREGWKYETERQARVVNVADLFPNGVEEFIAGQRMQEQQVAQQMLDAGQEAPPQRSPVDLVALRLANEYGMSLRDPEEAEQLSQAAQGILQGASFVRLVYEEIREDRPDWAAIDPLNVIVEQEGNPEQAPFVVVIHEYTRNGLRRAARDGQFLPRAVRAVLEKVDEQARGTDRTNRSGGAGGAAVRQQVRDFMHRRAGINRTHSQARETPRIPVWEGFCYLDLNGDGIKERCVLWYAPHQEVVLALYEYPMPFSEWPITLFQLEPHADRPVDSRGFPELLNEFNKLVNAYHNSRVDAGQILLAPVLQRTASSINYAQKIDWRPGQIFDVAQPGDIQPIAQDLRILGELIQEEQVTKREAETYIGTFDATLNQLNNPAERRTASEVNVITQLSANIFGLDSRIFQASMARSFQKIWKLWLEFGERETYFRVRGEPQPRLARKHEIDDEFDIVPAGSPSSTNKSFLLTNMKEMLPVVLQDQTGRFDAQELLKKYLQLIDYQLAQQIVRSPEQTAAAQQVMQAAQSLQGDEGQGPDMAV